MKKLITNLFSLWELKVASQCSDVRLDRRFTVGSPSVRYASNPIGVNPTKRPTIAGNNSLSALWRICAVLTLIFTLGVVDAWGATWTLSYSDFSTDSYSANDGDHTKDGISYNTSNVMRIGTNIQFKASNGTLYNKTAMPGNITKITAAGGLTIKVGAAQNPSSGTEATSGSAISGSYKYFWIKKTNSGAATVGSITVEYDIPAYTVSFDTGTGNPSVANRTEASGGAGITLPSTSDLAPACSSDGWVLYGWTTYAYGSSSTTTEPTTTLVGLAGTTYKPTSDIKLYAVYRKATVAATATTTTYTINGNWTSDNGNWTKVAGSNLSQLATGKWGINDGSSTAVSPACWTDIDTVTFNGTKSSAGAGSVEFLYGSGNSWTSLTSKSFSTSLTWSPSPKVTGQLKCVFTRTNGNIYIASIDVKGKLTTYTYWYAPTCETCDDPTALEKGSFNWTCLFARFCSLLRLYINHLRSGRKTIKNSLSAHLSTTDFQPLTFRNFPNLLQSLT